MNRNRKTAWLGLMTVAVGTCCLADLSAIAAETPSGNASAAEPAAERAPATGNLLRNGGFELDSVFNGSPMRQGTEFMRAVDLFQKRCPPPPCEGWWIEGSPGDGVSLESKEVHSGSRAIRFVPPEGERVSLVSAPEVPVPAGPLALSAWVRTTGAKRGWNCSLWPRGPAAISARVRCDHCRAGKSHCRRTPRSGAELRSAPMRRPGQPPSCGSSSSGVASWPTICNWRPAMSLRRLPCVRKSYSGWRSKECPSPGFLVGWRETIRRENCWSITVPTPRSTATWKFGLAPGRSRRTRSWPH